MATILPTPSVRAIAPFDPTNDYTIEFIYSGDPINIWHHVFVNEITDSDPNNHVAYYYNPEPQPGAEYHTIPAGSLEPGKKYSIFVMVYDLSDPTNIYSHWSDETPFWCFTTPDFYFTNASDSTHYESTSITLSLAYTQAEDEILSNYQFIKYSASGTQLDISPIMTLNDSLSYTFYGLDNYTTYKFKAIGETRLGMPIETEEITISVSVEAIPMNVSVGVVNDYMGGTVNLTFNIKDIEYTLSGDNYTFSDGMVTLNDTSLTYNNGFVIADDFSLFLEASKVSLGTFLSLENGLIQLSTINVCGIYYGVLSIKGSNFSKYVKLENAKLSDDGQLILDTTQSYVTFVIRRNGGYYDLELK